MKQTYFVIFLRSAVFNALFYINLIALMIVGLPIIALPNRRRAIWFAQAWGKSSVWLLRVICGTELEYRGRENIPRGAMIIAPKHQSIFETFTLTACVPDFSYVVKRELTWIPFFGWYLVRAEQISIDRSSGRAALAKVADAAKIIFAEGRALFMFPEGTRRPVGAPPAYKFGISYVYEAGGVPCLPIGLNAGVFWPRRSFLRYPGTIIIEFLPAIPPGLSKEDFMATLEQRTERSTNALVAEAFAESPWLKRFART